MAATSRVRSATFERIDHTSDVGVRLCAPTEAELFIAAVAALTALWGLPEASGDSGAPPERLEVTGGDTESLLVAWLNELIFQAAVLGRAAAAVRDPSLGSRSFAAQVVWRPVAWERCVDGADIKAATYHALHVTRTAGGCTASVIFDV